MRHIELGYSAITILAAQRLRIHVARTRHIMAFLRKAWVELSRVRSLIVKLGFGNYAQTPAGIPDLHLDNLISL